MLNSTKCFPANIYFARQTLRVSPEEVKAANNGLPEGLKAGLYIRVPTATIVETDTVVKPDVATVPPRGTPRKIAVLLPFTATARDTSEGAPSGDQSESPMPPWSSAREWQWHWIPCKPKD